MHCSYCGKGFWLASKVIKDPDFCRPTHRWKFRKRLELAMTRIEKSFEMHPTGTAGFHGSAQGIDSPYRPTLVEATVRIRILPVPRVQFNVIAETISVEEIYPAEPRVQEPVARADRSARLQRLSELVSGLRADIKSRREDTPTSSPSREPAAVIELKAAVCA